MSKSSKPTWSMELVPGQPMLHKQTLSHCVVMADGFNSSTLRREGRRRRFSDSEASLVYRDNSRTVKAVT